MKIFFSYAHADADFAHPLAEELKKYYDVWIDKDKLTLGDSIFQGLAGGLSGCDYGVVVLSPTYMKRTWCLRELGGLMAIEKQAGKVILPIWKDVTADEVEKFSGGMLNDKLSAHASDGAEAVVAMVRAAVESSKRTTEVAQKTSIAERFAALGKDVKAKSESDKQLRSQEGAGLVMAAFQRVLTEVGETLESTKSDDLPFKIKAGQFGLIAHTKWAVSMDIGTTNVLPNGDVMDGFCPTTAEHFVIKARIFQRPTSRDVFYNGPVEAPSLLEELVLRPAFIAGNVVWRTEQANSRPVEPAKTILESFLRHIMEARPEN